jgi:NAD(P)-dependent dehydrogenase (short-subunit alcohol dehydrogenase family)
MGEKKVVIVTGVSSGIGREIAALLSDGGFRVFGTVRQKSETGQSGSAGPIQLDVRDDESVRSAVREVLRQAGRIDALVNNAGSSLGGSLEETTIEEAKLLFETNFFGVMRVSQAVLPFMREQKHGRIINVSSVLGFLPAPYLGIYAASKHALEGYSESLDHEVRQFGIRVSMVEPGFMRTNLGHNNQLTNRSLPAYARERDSALRAVSEGIASGEEPSIVASVVLQALNSRAPKLRYPAGRQAKLLSVLKRFAPSKLVDNGVRKQFGLPRQKPAGNTPEAR